MIAFEALVTRVEGLARADLARWIDNRWVLPERRDGGWMFREVDIARVELIVEIRRDFALDDEAVELVLGLLDQIYGLRRQMRRLCDALAVLPPDMREKLRHALPPTGGVRDDP
jgi:chaperone modulatory protein CbpM